MPTVDCGDDRVCVRGFMSTATVMNSVNVETILFRFIYETK